MVCAGSLLFLQSSSFVLDCSGYRDQLGVVAWCVRRVVQRAVLHVQNSGREEVTGANVLVALFTERESHAVYFLQEQNILDASTMNLRAQRH